MKAILFSTIFNQRSKRNKMLYKRRPLMLATALGSTYVLLMTTLGYAEDIYISQNSQGANSGVDSANAHSVAWFNTASNWSNPKQSGKIGPGDTVHLGGTFTGSANSTMLTPQISGSSGNVITILFEQNAKLTAPYWNGSNGAINCANKSYITIDGGTNGLIEATANGTSLANQQTSCGIVLSGGSYDNVKNLTINNMYVHSSTSDTAVDQANTNGVKFLNSSNVTIDHVAIKDAGWALNGWGNNITISNCDVSNIDHGVAIGPTGTITNVNIFGNHFHNYVNWDTTANSYHHDGIHMFAGLTSGGAAGDRVNGGNIYNNTFDGDSGVNITAHIFLEEQIQNINIFNNIFIVPSNRTMNVVWLEGRNNGSDTYASGHGVSNAFYNNYVNGGRASGGGAAFYTRYQNTVSIKNNILVGGGGSIALENTTIATGGINNNVYAIVGGGNTFGFNTMTTDSLATWQAALPSGSGQDSASWAGTFANILINSNGTLQSGSPAIGAGANLTSLAITTLNYDKNLVGRPSSGAWDVGAYTSSNPSSLLPPVIRILN